MDDGEPNLTKRSTPPDERQWLTLGLARALLGINEATLRHWADEGLVRAFRTPGGHRRFSAEDIRALIEGGGRPMKGVRVAGDARVLPRVRQLLRGSTRKQPPTWMALFDPDGHERMRLLGREFLELCIDFIDHPHRTEAVAEAARLGSSYGRELAGRGVTLGDALQAFMFFRNTTLDALKPSLLKRGVGPEGVCFAIEQFIRLTDEVLKGIAAHYQQPPLETT